MYLIAGLGNCGEKYERTRHNVGFVAIDYLADKYDVEAASGEDRIRVRVENAMNDEVQASFLGYDTVLPTARQIRIDHSRAKYVLLPVWLTELPETLPMEVLFEVLPPGNPPSRNLASGPSGRAFK